MKDVGRQPAEAVRPKLQDILPSRLPNPALSKLAQVVMDFPSRELCAEIVHTNFLQSKVSGLVCLILGLGEGENSTPIPERIDESVNAALWK